MAGWQALAVAAGRRAALEWGDVAVAAGAASVVAAVASPALVPLGAAACLPLVVAESRDAGFAPGLRVGLIAVLAGGGAPPPPPGPPPPGAGRPPPPPPRVRRAA